MSNITISQLPAASSPNENYTIAADNSLLTQTQKLTVKQINDLSRIFPVFAIGNVSGTRSINFAPDRLLQTVNLNGTSTVFTKGTGWPTSNGVGCDVVLNITVSSPTAITWTIVSTWFNSPPSGALSSGTHVILLRAVGTIIQGYYIANNI